MDRNTLLAFFLISLVLIFTPKYIELISGKNRTDKRNLINEEPNIDTLKQIETSQFEDLDFYSSGEVIVKDESPESEITTVVENNLFLAELTSKNGGSFKTFYLKSYFDKDSQRVNLINNKTQTLTSELKTFNGDILDLSSSWNLQNNLVPEIIEDSLELIYTKRLLNRYTISKSLTFYSDSYKILCELDLRMVPKDLIDNNLKISWFGGLKPTEQNIDDDQLYFQVYSFLGGEKETFKVKESKPDFFTYNGALEWGAIRTKYFTLAFLPKDPNSIRKTIVSTDF